jgi:Icc-related predicted phosphoesterase
MRFIGDVHGKYKQYHRLIKEVDASIQVGDMGVGFRYHGYRSHDIGKACPNPYHDLMVRQNARFIRGNHDNPNVCRNHSQWIPDGTIEMIGNSKVMFIGGATSIDIHTRLEGYSWWPDEELNISELYRMYDLFMEEKPDIMVTHECPTQVAALLVRSFKLEHSSGSRQAFESMFESHKPSMWIFGHYHQPFKMDIYGTEFICLAELETLDIEL